MEAYPNYPPAGRIEDLPHRVYARVRVSEAGCWLWTGPLNNSGYARVWFGNERVLAHRLAYELFVERIPGDLQIDHLCKVRNCLNPNHLEPVTAAENVRRARGLIRGHHARCGRGHDLTADGVGRIDTRGKLVCRECERIRGRKKQAALTPAQIDAKRAYHRARYWAKKAERAEEEAAK